jgi:N-acetylneuraminate synthase/N,N'-diacetyllegionaminate synthase
MREVSVGGRRIGEGHPAFIIAEIGSNHNGSLQRAKRLIDLAAKAKADAVKFQYYKAEHLFSRRTPGFNYLKKVDTWELIKSIETPRSWTKALAEHCEERGVIFFASAFDREAVDLLEDYVPAYKIASFEIVDLDFIKYTAKKGKPILLATGMANLGEIEEALEAIRSVGNEDIVLMQCTSLYPAPVVDVNLAAMATMERAFKLPVGLSDHTLGIHISLAAVAMGAKTIEKHYTLDRKLLGPDHPFAIQPEELRALVSGIRDIERAMGTGIKDRTKHESEEMYYKGRRSLHARVRIPKGKRIEEDMLVVKRPGYGIKPRDEHLVVGRTARRDIKPDEWITWDMV